MAEKSGEMSNHNNIRSLISSFSGQDRMITIPKIYIELTGEYAAASLLNQIVFWSDKSKRNDGFFYKTYKEWEEELSLSEYQVRRSVEKLEEKGVVETKLKKANGSPTIHYKLDYEALQQWILKNLKDRNQRTSSMDTEGNEESLTVDYKHKNTTVDKDHSPAKAAQIPYKEIIEHLNEKTGKNISYKSKGNRNLIKARWNEDYTLEDFKKVIDNKVADWFGKDVTFNNGKKAETYLHPSTLFRLSNFDKYLNQEPTEENAATNNVWGEL